MMKNNNLDKVTLVDTNDQVIGEMDKYKAHEHPAKLHRAVSVWLINDQGETLLQKRSKKKIVGATWWGNTICGNLRPTETYLECAVRRLKEEVGIIVDPKDNQKETLELIPVHKFIYKAYCNEKYGEHEIDQVFIAKYNEKAIPNKDEVSEVAWVDLNNLTLQLKKNIKLNSPLRDSQKTLDMNLEQLKLQTAPYKFEVNEKNQLLAPWSCMMLNSINFEKYQIKLI